MEIKFYIPTDLFVDGVATFYNAENGGESVSTTAPVITHKRVDATTPIGKLTSEEGEEIETVNGEFFASDPEEVKHKFTIKTSQG